MHFKYNLLLLFVSEKYNVCWCALIQFENNFILPRKRARPPAQCLGMDSKRHWDYWRIIIQNTIP